MTDIKDFTIPRKDVPVTKSQLIADASTNSHAAESPHESAATNNSKITELSSFLGKEKIKANPYVVGLPVVIVATFLAVSLALCIWIIVRLVRDQASWTAGSLIGDGGSFTQPQAKILDLVSSAILAPMIVALFNYYCFRSARSCVVNVKSGRRHSVPLQALVEVSTTDWGSYSPFKLFIFARTRQLRILLLATIALGSAISFSALTNLVAYEASTQKGWNSTVALQYLYRAPDRTIGTNGMAGTQMPWLITTQQKANFSSQWFQVLTALSYSPADTFLDNGAYIGINMTNASLARLPLNTTSLLSVPAFELTYDCHTAKPNLTGLTTMARRMAYEIALEVPALDPAEDVDLTYEVVAQFSVLRYRMTFVPWILVAGLAAMVLVGVFVLCLEIMGKGIRDERVVTPLRMVVDAGAGLGREAFQGKEEWSDDAIEEWGKGCRVGYVDMDCASGRRVVRLRAK